MGGRFQVSHIFCLANQVTNYMRNEQVDPQGGGCWTTPPLAEPRSCTKAFPPPTPTPPGPQAGRCSPALLLGAHLSGSRSYSRSTPASPLSTKQIRTRPHTGAPGRCERSVCSLFSFQFFCVQRVEATSIDLGSVCSTENTWSGRQWWVSRGAPRCSLPCGRLLCPEH